MDVSTVEFDPFRDGEVERTAPTTEPQREIITSACLGDQANIAFNEAISLRISGAVDADDVERALGVLVSRHEILRSTFTRRGDELVVNAGGDFTMDRRDLTGVADGDRETAIEALWQELATTPLNLFDGPLFCAYWLQLDAESAELVLLSHHVVCDGWSFYVLLEELGKLLGGESPASLPAAPSFAEFAERQAATAVSNADADYWAERFSTRPPVLDLPTDGQRPAFRTFDAMRLDYSFDSDLTKAIGSAAGKLRASVVNFVLACTAVLLNRLTNNDDIAVGLPVARQSADNMPGLVGHGVQLLPIRLGIRDDDKFADLVGQVKSRVLDAREHFNFTFGTLVRAMGLSGDPSRVPLVPVIFNIDQPFDEMNFGAGTASVRTVPRAAENFEIFLNILPTADRLVIEATFNTDLFAAQTIQSWLSALESLTRNAVANPEARLRELGVSAGMPPVYKELNATEFAIDSTSWLRRFAAAVSASPEKIAVRDADRELSYAELDKMSTMLAIRLAEASVEAGNVVGIYMDRTVDLLIAVAGIHKAACAYVPLDPAFPEARLEFMLRDSGAVGIVSNRSLPEFLANSGLPVLEIPVAGSSEESNRDLPSVAGEDLAYVIYTSGSTGQPKGVEIQHAAVGSFLESMARRPGLNATDCLLAVTTLSFDISVLELLLPLTRAATVVVATREQAGDPRQLAGLIDGGEITVLQATASTWRLLLRNGWSGSQSLTALCGGEPLPSDLAAQLLQKVGQLWNMYGPTETTVWSTCQKIESANAIAVGRPIGNTTVYVMGSNGFPNPPGIPGEIWIGGQGLARGYRNRADLTAECFIDHSQLGRLYRTGDRGRILAGGEIEHLGRLDDQVKVRGFRIELAEIEVALTEHDSVEQAAVHLWSPGPDDVRIVACCIAAGPATLAPMALRKHLATRLPEYMVPQHFLVVEEIPLTPNGKVDRRQLPIPVVTSSRIGRHEAPVDSVEATIASIWNLLLHPERPIGRNDRFFEVGGHSLLALECLRQIEQQLDTQLGPRVLFKSSLAEIANLCRAEEAPDGATGSVEKLRRLNDDEARVLSPTQQRIFRSWADCPGMLRYHIPFSLRLEGEFDADKFSDALESVFDRNEALRTIIETTAEGPRQALLPCERACVLDQIDLSSNANAEDAAMEYMVERTKEPFDLEQGPLVKMALLNTGEGGRIFFFMPHQIVFDGWSFDVFLKQLDEAYGLRESKQPLSASVPAIDFADYAAWLARRPGIDRDPDLESYWQQALKSLPPPLRWPGDAPSDKLSVGRVRFTIPRPQVEEFEAFCSEHGYKIQTLVLAAFGYVLGRAFDRDEILIALASAGRFRPDVASIIGSFYSDLPLRLSVPKEIKAGELVGGAESAIAQWSQQLDVTQDELDGVSGLGQQLTAATHQVKFSFQEARSRNKAIGSLSIRQISVSRPELEADVDFWVRNTPDGLIASLDYRHGLAEPRVFVGIRDDFLRVLTAAATSRGAAINGLVKTALVGGETESSGGRKRLLDRLLKTTS